MSKELIGRISRYLAGAYFVFTGVFTLVKSLVDVLSPKDNMSLLLNSSDIFVNIGWASLYIAMAFTLFKNKRHYFWAIILFLVLWGAAGKLILSYAGSLGKNSTNYSIIASYLVLAVLVFLSRYLEPTKEEDNINKARRILGDGANQFSDSQLADYLKK